MSLVNWLKKPEHTEEKVHVASAETEALRQNVIQALRQIYDPEIPVNIYDLGLIYALDVDEKGAVRLRMTLTAPTCPVAQTFPETVECAVNAVPGVSEASVELVWDPPWTSELMSESARLELGML
jgi:FeS assembly SUF system protein